MKKTTLPRLLATMAALAVITITATSCNKENDNIRPIDPTDTIVPAEPNLFIYGEDTLTITAVTRDYDSDYGIHTTTLHLSDGNTFNIQSMIYPEGEFNFLRLNEFYTTPDSVAGALKIGQANYYLHLGTLSVHYIFNQAVINIQGLTEINQPVSAHYSGIVTDESTPMGEGSFALGSSNFNINMVYGIVRSSVLGHYTITSTDLNTRLTLHTAQSLMNGKQYQITQDTDLIADGNHLGLDITYNNNGQLATATATSGTLDFIINRNGTVTITANGTTPHDNFTLTYIGDFLTLVFAN